MFRRISENELLLCLWPFYTLIFKAFLQTYLVLKASLMTLFYVTEGPINIVKIEGRRNNFTFFYDGQFQAEFLLR